MRVAVLGPGGVGGLVAGALDRAGVTVSVIARQSTAETISKRGLRVSSVLLGDFVAWPHAVTRLGTDADGGLAGGEDVDLEDVDREDADREDADREDADREDAERELDVLIVATKAGDLLEASDVVVKPPRLILPLLNGLDHVAVLRERFGDERVVAGTIRVEADRPEPGVVVHTSRFLRVDMASRYPQARAPMERLAGTLSHAGIPARVYPPTDPAPTLAERAVTLADGGEAQVMWSKLVRLNALACTTSAYDRLLGEIRDTPELRADLLGAIEEGCAVARAEGASIATDDPLGELTAAHATLGSSMQRDIAAGRPPELDAIPGAVLRAATRHGIECPTIERLVAMIRARVDRRQA